MTSMLTSLFGMQPEAAAEAAGNAAQAAEPLKAYERPLPANPVDTSTYWMPDQASAVSDSIDWLYYGLLGLTAFWTVVITAAVVYFCIKYRSRRGHKAEPSAAHNDALEITWTIVPSIIVVIIFVLGWRSYVELTTPPRNALEIDVNAKKWSWLFTHSSNGRSISDDELHVPVDTPVTLTMTSADVLHSLFVPAFRVKQDVVPKRYTKVWFEATEPGWYRLYCTEYCGKEHSLMKTRVRVHDSGGYQAYLQEQINKQMQMPPEELGKELYTQRGCVACHTADGSPSTGPTFKGLFGSERKLDSGETVTADENYVRESIVDPQAKIVSGFQPVMPPFAGQLSEKEIQGLIAYIESLQ